MLAADDFLQQAEAVIQQTEPLGTSKPPQIYCGVDLGTAYTVVAVLDQDKRPMAGASRFAQVVRDGVVVDFHGAVELLRELKGIVEARLGFPLLTAATTFPPGVPEAEVRATRFVLESAELTCTALIDEPTAANAVLGLQNGAVVDIGGGTTGIAILEDGEVVYVADEPTGGTHFSLVISGALGMSFEEAERYKIDPSHHAELFPLVKPVMEKVGTIVARHVANYKVETIHLVGGTASFIGIADVIHTVTGIPALVPYAPLYPTPFGVAMFDSGEG